MVDKPEGTNPKADAGSPGKTAGLEETRDGLFSTVTSHLHLTFTLFLLFLLAVIYQWKTISVDSVMENMHMERKILTAKIERILLDKNIDLVRLSAIPLTWAVRSEMNQNNLENIDRYFKRLIRESHFKSIALSNIEGTIIVATDKKLEGAKAARIYPPKVLDHSSTKVIVLANGDILGDAPVLDVSGKLGDLIIVYAPENENLETTGQ